MYVAMVTITISVFVRKQTLVVFHFSMFHPPPMQSAKMLQSSPHFFLDAFYIHEPPTEDNDAEVGVACMMCSSSFLTDIDGVKGV